MASKKDLVKMERVLKGGHDSRLLDCVTSTKTYVITGGSDGKAVVWERGGAGKIVRMLEGHKSGVMCLDTTPNEKYVVTGSWDKSLILWKLSNGNRERSFVGHTDRVYAVAVTPSGDGIVSGSYDKTAILWNIHDSSRLLTFKGHEGPVRGVVISSSGLHLYTCSEDKTAIKWSMKTGERLDTFKGHEDRVYSCCLTSDNKYLLTASWDRTAIVWNADDTTRLRTLKGHSKWVESICVSSCAPRIVATGSRDNTVILWDFQTAKPICTLKDHKNDVKSVHISKDNLHLLSASWDGSAIQYDISKLFSSPPPLPPSKPDPRVVATATFAYDHHYRHSYPEPAANASDAFRMDWSDKHGVARPNHSLCDAVRKAMLAPHVIRAYTMSGTSEYGSFAFGPTLVVTLQIAILFECCGRASDIGHADDMEVFMSYHEKSCRAFDAYARRVPLQHRKVCLDALECVYMRPKSKESHAVQRVIEICHDLDLFRCYGRTKMKGKVEKLAKDVGRKAAEDLARRAERAILATGDRLWCSYFDTPTRDYVKKDFVACSKNVQKCFDVVGATIGMADLPKSFKHPDPIVKGEMMISRRVPTASASADGSAKKQKTEEPLRLLTSRYRELLTATNTRWRSLDYWKRGKVSKATIQKRVDQMVTDLVMGYCRSKQVAPEQAKTFLKDLKGIVRGVIEKKHDRSTAEVVALILWTSTIKLDVRGKKMELCSILNELIRGDGGNAAFEPTVHLVCMIQHFLNATRRDAKYQIKPLGPSAPIGKGRSTTKDTVYRGSTLPAKHLGFFEALAGKNRYYRAAHLVATSFDMAVAYKFLDPAFDRIPAAVPKVLWEVKIHPIFGCNNVSFIDDSLTDAKGEQEYLFSAYSAFKVLKVERSADPTDYTTPHKITIEAAFDNSRIPESVPTSPWC
eukprot:g913.t1